MVEAKWKLVPVEPTEEMLAAGDAAMVDTVDNENWLRHCRNAWEAMLCASPAPALPESGVEGVRAALLSPAAIEAAAKAVQIERGLGVNTLHQHHEWEDWPIDAEQKSLDNQLRETTIKLHFAWRKNVPLVRAVIEAALATPAPAPAPAPAANLERDFFRMTPREVHTALAAPAPAPAPVDAAGLVKRLRKYGQGRGDRYCLDTHKAISVMDEAASALAAAAEREAALVRDCELLAKHNAEAEAETEHWARLSCDDLGKNPPTFWKERALAAEARVTAAEAERDAERERCAAIVDDWIAQHVACLNDDAPSHAGRHSVAVKDGRAIAAAIRKETTA